MRSKEKLVGRSGLSLLTIIGLLGIYSGLSDMNASSYEQDPFSPFPKAVPYAPEDDVPYHVAIAPTQTKDMIINNLVVTVGATPESVPTPPGN